ncbi:protoheme IX farnesyltransferase [Flavobacterium orientale]|uniref:Protoheme IX farnesyltransferase n=1 Tax=Flavobacterium orientale TaxID=1756020 RepID=A0A916Y7Z6_9FLAO|nr:protoheme IX farnesyltransferase [Flavobacterium orientale]
MKTALNVTQNSISTKALFTDFKEITKAGLSISVVFSSLAGYLLGVVDFSLDSLKIIALLAIGGYCMVGASNAYNQIIERELDALMDRTKNRPLPAGRISVSATLVIAIILTLIGLVVLYSINPKTAMFGAISIFLYTSVYTPLKTLTPLSVFVGAIPGAIPFMLGWVAATNDFSLEAGTLFLIQFFWQFPHFWAIGWFLFEDYKKAGFFMLPTGKRDAATALQTILYTVWLLVASLLPAIFPHIGIVGSRLYLSPIAAVLVFALGIWMLVYAFKLYQKRDAKAAKSLMIVSVFYITLLQIVFVADKFLR